MFPCGVSTVATAKVQLFCFEAGHVAVSSYMMSHIARSRPLGGSWITREAAGFSRDLRDQSAIRQRRLSCYSQSIWWRLFWGLRQAAFKKHLNAIYLFSLMNRFTKMYLYFAFYLHLHSVIMRMKLHPAIICWTWESYLSLASPTFQGCQITSFLPWPALIWNWIVLQGFGGFRLLCESEATAKLLDSVIALFCHFKTAEGCRLLSVH